MITVVAGLVLSPRWLIERTDDRIWTKKFADIKKRQLCTRLPFTQIGPTTLCNGLLHRSLKVSDLLGLYPEIWPYTVAHIS